MRAMLFTAARQPLQAVRRAIPEPAAGQLLLRVLACGVCRTDLHIADGELALRRSPRILGHQIVGRVEQIGAPAPAGGRNARAEAQADDQPVELGEVVGVPWLGWACGSCRFCKIERENLCTQARFTGLDIDGGFAEWTLADARFCHRLPEGYQGEQAAPLLCGGLIGFRALRFCGDAETIGLFGFGASAHIIAQVAVAQGRRVLAFTRDGDDAAQRLAGRLGAAWAGASEDQPPAQLQAAIIFAPVGALVKRALELLEPGGTVVCAGIHMSDLPPLPYELLWHERSIQSVANLTRRDGRELLALAPQVPIRTEVHLYGLEQVNAALDDLRAGRFAGAAVIVP